MQDIEQLSLLSVVALAFASMFVCASLIRARGVTGLLALLGAAGVAIVVFADLHDFRLAAGGIAALLGLTFGGKVSDYRERQRFKRISEQERRKRDALMKGGMGGD